MNLRCPNCGSMITYLTDNVTDPLNPTYICADCNYLFTEKDSLTSVPIDKMPNTDESDQHAKADAGKEPISLVPMQIVRDISRVRQYGNAKYGDPDNWKTVDVGRYRDALGRHLLLYLEDPTGLDEESGLPHLYHVACNVAFLCSLEDFDRDAILENLNKKIEEWKERRK